MKLLLISKGKYVKLDDEDYEWLSKYKWYYSNGYAKRWNGRNKKPQLIRMHREIMQRNGQDIENLIVDHVNGDTLNNQKSNLRFASYSQNLSNRCKPSNNTSGYKGVSYRKHGNFFEAYITANGKRIRLGLFDSPVTAAMAYDFAAIKYHKQFAILNFPDKKPEKVNPRKVILHNHNSSGYRGVSQRENDKWRMDFQHKDNKHTGTFKTDIEAAKAYDKIARKYLGHKARLNFPDG